MSSVLLPNATVIAKPVPLDETHLDAARGLM